MNCLNILNFSVIIDNARYLSEKDYRFLKGLA